MSRGKARLWRPRWVQRMWAGVFGYFWLPCRECGRMYGGHETAPGAINVYDPAKDGCFSVCRACGPIVRERQLRELEDLGWIRRREMGL